MYLYMHTRIYKYPSAFTDTNIAIISSSGLAKRIASPMRMLARIVELFVIRMTGCKRMHR